MRPATLALAGIILLASGSGPREVVVEEPRSIPVVVDDEPEHREGPPPRNLKIVTHSKPVVTMSIGPELLRCIRAYETGGGVIGRANYSDDGPPYCGAYQFSCSDDPTKVTMWRSYFGDRRPADVSAEEQDNAALTVLRHDGGIKPTRWPTPYKRCR